MQRIFALILISSILIHSFGSPVQNEGPREAAAVETPGEDRFSLIPPYDINPYFGFRKYGELRYEPLTLPFFPPAPIPFGPPPPPGPNYSPSAPYSQSPPNYPPRPTYGSYGG